MGIRSDLDRIKGAKDALKTAIEGKGVTVPSNTLIDGYPALVDSISAGPSITNGLEVTAFNASMSPTAVTVIGNKIWEKAFSIPTSNANASWAALESISAPNATEGFAYGISRLTSLTSVSLPLVTTLGQYCIYGNTALTSISLPELTTAGSYAIYGNNFVQSYYFPKCTSTSGTRPMGFSDANTTLTTVQLGSIGYPVTALSVGTFYNATSASLVITVYVTPGSQPLAGSPWSATNATIVYRSAVDGSVL